MLSDAEGAKGRVQNIKICPSNIQKIPKVSEL